MTPKLDKKVSKVCGVLNLSKESTYEDLSSLLELFIVGMENCNYVSHYFAIIHDDSDVIHIHYAILMDSQKRILTMINKLCEICNLEPNQVSIEHLKNLNAILRYFLHMNEDKKKYKISDIKSDMSTDEIASYVNSDSDAQSLTSKQLITSVLLYPNECDLMCILGLQTFHKYRNEIRTLYDHHAYVQSHYGYLLDEQNSNNLPF